MPLSSLGEFRDEAAIILTAMMGGLVRYAKSCQKEKFRWGNFLLGLITSGLVGYVSYGICAAFELSMVTTSSIAAMCGYSGGALLDALHTGILESIQTFFNAVIKTISRHGNDSGNS